MMLKLSGCISRLKMMNYLKIIVVFCIKSGIIQKKTSVANLQLNFAFEKFFVVQKNFQRKIQRSSFEAKTFHEKEMSEAGSNYICLVVMLIDSVLKKDENYYSQVFFKNVTTLQKKKKHVIRYIYDDLQFSSDANDKKNSDEED